MTLEQGVLAGATVALLLALARAVPRPDRATMRHPAVIGASMLFLISLVVRALAVQPTIIHADVVGPELVDCILQFPEVCTTRGKSYGQYGFLFVGALTRAWGNDLAAVFRAMGSIGAASVVLLALLARRLSGSPYGALFAVAVTGTNPVFLRIAASEDMHTMGLFLGLIALIAMDAFAVSRRTAPLIAATLALCLLVHTRQSFYLFAPCAFLLAVARADNGLLASPRFWGAGLSVVAVLAMHTAANLSSTAFTRPMVEILSQPLLLPTILRHHPLLDATRFGPLPLLTLAALAWAVFGGRLARGVVLAFLANFIATYPIGMPSPGVELAQRLPALAFGALPVTMAGAAVVERRVGERLRHVVGVGLAAVLAALPPFFPGWRMLAVLTPVHREYLAVESAAAGLPMEFTLVKAPTAEGTVHGNARYAGLLARLGKRVTVAPATAIAAGPPPRLFLEDVECWTYSFHELTGSSTNQPPDRMREVRWDRVIFAGEPSPLRPPPGRRPECERILRGASPIGAPRLITDPPDDPPFLFYASRAVPIQFHALGGPLAAQPVENGQAGRSENSGAFPR